jgi:hypothetical protein
MGTGKIAKSSTLLAAAIPSVKITCHSASGRFRMGKKDGLSGEPIFCHFILSRESAKEKGGTV